MAGYKGHQTRMRNRRVADYQTGVEARIAKARARLAHDPNVDPVDPAAGDVVVSDCEYWWLIPGIDPVLRGRFVLSGTDYNCAGSESVAVLADFVELAALNEPDCFGGPLVWDAMAVSAPVLFLVNVTGAWNNALVHGGHPKPTGTATMGTRCHNIDFCTGGGEYAPNYTETSAPSVAGMGGGRLC